MEHVTYQFYVDEYHGGAVSSEEWPAAEREAQAELARLQRICTVTAPTENSLSFAICAAAEVLTQQARASASNESGPVSSASIGSVSVSYGHSTDRASAHTADRRELMDAFTMYLDIYTGVG